MSECTFSHVASLILWLICNRHETMAISMSYYPQLSVNRLRDLYIPRKKWLNGLQTVETLTRRRVLRRLTWVCTVCQLPSLRVSDYNGLSDNKRYYQAVNWAFGVRVCLMDTFTAGMAYFYHSKLTK